MTSMDYESTELFQEQGKEAYEKLEHDREDAYYEPLSVQEAELEDTTLNLLALQHKLIQRRNNVDGMIANHDCKIDPFGTHGCQCSEWVVELYEVNDRLRRISEKLWK